MSETNNGARMARVSKTNVADIIGTKKNAVTATASQVEETRGINIAANTFYKIIHDPALTPEQKQKAVAETLSKIGTKEENRERLRQLEEYKEYLQLQRENMAQKIISITDTDVMARLQEVFVKMNNGMLEYDEAMKPIMDIIDAMHVVRKEGKTNELFAEIRDDRRNELAFDAELNDIKKRFDSAQRNIDDLLVSNSVLAEKKGFFGFGGTTEEARTQIARNNVEIERLKGEASNIEKNLSELTAKKQEAVNDETEYGKAKNVIRGMLDLSADEHRENQKLVVAKATDFVKTSKQSLGDIRGHLVSLNGQIDNLIDGNQFMTAAYAVLGEGMKDAEKTIRAERETVATPSDDEGMIAKMQRDDKIRVIDDHASMLSTSYTDTELTFADLSSQRSRITTMKDANTGQMDKVRKMHTQGVAGVADRLSVVLQAVSQAAIGEASAIAKDTMTQMNDSTNMLAMKESMRVAMQGQEVNSDIVKAMEDLEAYGEVTRAATGIMTESVTEIRTNLEQLKSIASNLQDDLKEQSSIHSVAGNESPQVQNSPQSVDSDVFKF